MSRKWLRGVGIIACVLVPLIGMQSVLDAYFTPRPPGYLERSPAGSFVDIDWTELAKGHYDAGGRAVAPSDIQLHNGALVHLEGFLVPFHAPVQSAHFFMGQGPRGCYFCNPPGPSEVIQVNIAGEKQLQITSLPVHVYGRLRLATGAPTDEAMYMVDNASLQIGH